MLDDCYSGQLSYNSSVRLRHEMTLLFLKIHNKILSNYMVSWFQTAPDINMLFHGLGKTYSILV